MNHLAARQRQDTGRWNYTTANRRTGCYAIGYCAGYPLRLSDEDAIRYYGSLIHYESYLEKLSPYKGKFHSGGHETAEAAMACYREYLLDHNLRVVSDPNTARKCRVCEEWTTHAVIVGGYGPIISLCGKHQSRNHVEPFVDVGESWES